MHLKIEKWENVMIVFAVKFTFLNDLKAVIAAAIWNINN
jgi:hypothetical protein